MDRRIRFELDLRERVTKEHRERPRYEHNGYRKTLEEKLDIVDLVLEEIEKEYGTVLV